MPLDLTSSFSALPKLCGNCAFPQNFHTKKLGEITASFAVSATAHQLNLQGNLFDKTNSSGFIIAFVICDSQNINVLFGVLDYKHSILSFDLDDESPSGGISDNTLLYNIGLSQIHFFFSHNDTIKLICSVECSLYRYANFRLRWNSFIQLRKSWNFFIPWVHTKKMSSIYLRQTQGFKFCIVKKSVFNLSINLQAYRGGDFVSMAIPEICWFFSNWIPKKNVL